MTIAKYYCLFLGKKHQFLTFFHRFLETFYIFLVTHYSIVNELWFDITWADTSKKWIIWQFVRNKTFILGIKRQFLTLFHRFLEIFYIFLLTHYSTVNEWWFDFTLADTSKKWIIWQTVYNNAFILGRKHQFLTFFTDFWKYFIISYTILLIGELVMVCDKCYLIYHKKESFGHFVRYKTFILGTKHQFL